MLHARPPVQPRRFFKREPNFSCLYLAVKVTTSCARCDTMLHKHAQLVNWSNALATNCNETCENNLKHWPAVRSMTNDEGFKEGLRDLETSNSVTDVNWSVFFNVGIPSSARTGAGSGARGARNVGGRGLGERCHGKHLIWT